MGTRTLYLSADVVIKDHPHAYGDKYNVGGTTPSKKGSSPRVWGQVLKKYSDAIINRIIPTRMGTSIFGHREFILQQDHPHAYGDKILFLQQRKSPIGSSPRVWGQVHICRYLCKSLGIIPTRMGTSFVNFIIKLRQQDHPHAYGDKISGNFP